MIYIIIANNIENYLYKKKLLRVVCFIVSVWISSSTFVAISKANHVFPGTWPFSDDLSICCHFFIYFFVVKFLFFLIKKKYKYAEKSYLGYRQILKHF